jgi:hypothetical protein
MLVVAVTSAAAAPPAVSFGVDIGVVSRDIEEEAVGLGTALGIADSTRVTARLGLQMAPMLLIFGDIGVADLSVDEFDRYRSDLSPLYGGGARLVLFDSPYPQRFFVYTDLSVSRLKTDDQVVICVATCNDPSLVPTEELAEEELAWTEYAVAIGVKGRHENFRPFGGVHLSKLDGTDHVRTTQLSPGDLNFRDSRADVRERDSVGFFLGADILLDRQERTAITIQLSGIDENALRVGYKIAF